MLSPFLFVNGQCDEVVARLKPGLASVGLRVVQTFDLKAARLGQQDCACPNHGTSECKCQMVVLFLYEDPFEPLTLILHGHDGQTWLSLAEHLDRRENTRAVHAIQDTLKVPNPDGNRPNCLSTHA